MSRCGEDGVRSDQQEKGAAAGAFHVLAKPAGAACNLDCGYCFYLAKAALYPGSTSQMSDATLEAYIRQLLEAQRGIVTTIAWQGGEPSLMGLDFYRRAVEIIERYRHPGQQVEHTFQTNGVLLDDEWAAFFKQHGFLVGLSVDGPQALHDAYRVNKGGQGTFRQVMAAWEHLARHGVETNILCTVHAANQDHGRRVYCFFRDEMRAEHIQFIPIVEHAAGSSTAGCTVGAEQYGRFLADVFEEWVRHDVGRVFVQLFEATLNAHFGQHPLCVHAPTCGHALALEHNGDLYACDHFVAPDFLLGNIHDTSMAGLVSSGRQAAFGQAKRAGLTRQCRSCGVRSLCNGGCPKDRFVNSRDGEPGHNYLCPGLYYFFQHTGPAMRAMAQLLRRGLYADGVMALVAAGDARLGHNDPCPCDSGQTFKRCHGRALLPE